MIASLTEKDLETGDRMGTGLCAKRKALLRG